MNKLIAKANELWRENRIERALECYQKALTGNLLLQDRQAAHHMVAYLNCLLARRSGQESTFLGVDLRTPYEDYYLHAGQHLAAIDDVNFDAQALGLPVIGEQAMAYVEQQYAYYSQLKDVYVDGWRLRCRDFVNQCVNSLLHRGQQHTRA